MVWIVCWVRLNKKKEGEREREPAEGYNQWAFSGLLKHKNTDHSTNTESHGGSPRNDNAQSQTSQIQPEAQSRQHQESTQVTEIENNESINNQPHLELLPSFTSQYDYDGNEDYFYLEPITAQQQTSSSFMLNPSSYNFSGLQVGNTNIWWSRVYF